MQSASLNLMKKKHEITQHHKFTLEIPRAFAKEFTRILKCVQKKEATIKQL